MSKLGRLCTERKMNRDKHVCLGGATAVAAGRGMQPHGPANEGHRPPILHLFWRGVQHDASGAAWGRERENEDRGKMRTEDCSHSVHSRGEQAALGRSE